MEQNGEEPLMVTAAKKDLLNLFSETNRSLWFLSFPSSSTKVVSDDDPPLKATESRRRSLLLNTSMPGGRRRSRIAAPSLRTYEVVPISTTEDTLQEYISVVLQSLADAIDEIFNCTSVYNTSYWNTFIHTLLFELSAGLVTRPEYVRSEAEVRYTLINPLLNHVANSISMIAAPEGCTAEVFSSRVSYEQKTEERPNIPGSKPRVDYLITGRSEEGVLYLLPVETKRRHFQKDMAQLAQYMSSLGQQISSTCVGYLIDEDSLHIAFAPLTMPEEVLVPIVFVSPALKWRNGPSLDSGVCVSMCLLQCLFMTRTAISVDTINTIFKDKAKVIIETGNEMKATPPVLLDKGQVQYLEAMEQMKTEFSAKLSAVESQLSELKRSVKDMEDSIPSAPKKARKGT